MLEYIKKVAVQIREFFYGLSPSKKFATIFTFFFIFFGIYFLFQWAGNKTYVPLMTNLNPEDSTGIIRILREKHIPFKVDVTGKDIFIPPENLYEFRLELATMGLPQFSVVGYEVFDKQSIGVSNFVQKMNQKRAQEGELIRTINTIKGVKRSRVHLAIPQKNSFLDEQKKPTASVVVDLDPGVFLSEKQVYGIGNLVASAVEGLSVSDVIIMNSEGKVLSKNPTEPLSVATATQLEYQGKVELDLEKRIESVLSPIVGEGHVVAKVTADLDFSQTNETQTLFDADGSAVRSVEKRNDNMNGSRPSPYGVSGNIPNPANPTVSAQDIKTETTKNNEITHYEVPQTVRKTVRTAGSIRRLSVAVVIDGRVNKTLEKDGKIITKVEPWTADKLKEFQDIVVSAVGIDKKRGDLLEIKNIEFNRGDFDESQRMIAEKEQKNYIENLIIYAIIGLSVALFFLVVVRPFIKWITENTIDSVDTFLPQTIEELERIQKTTTLPALEEVIPPLPEAADPLKIEGEMIKEKIVNLVDTNPLKAALIIRDWLHIDHKKHTDESINSENLLEEQKIAAG